MSVIRPHLDTLTAPGAPFEIVEEVVFGQPIRTYANRMRHLGDFITVGSGHGDAEFLVQGDRRVSFAGAFASARRLAAALRGRFGIRAGDRVGVVGANAVDWVVAYWAAVAADAVVVPFNAWWTAEELAFGLEDSDTAFVFADDRRAAVVAAAGFDVERLAVWGDGTPPPGATTMADLAADALGEVHLETARGEDETAVIFYTSGTTGRPKGSANTHRNVISNFMNAASMSMAAALAAGHQPTGAGGQDVDLCVIPLFHATANLATMTPFVFAGNKLVFLPPGRFDPEEAGRVIEAEAVTRFGGVPTIVARILDSAVHERYDFSSVGMISYGGAPAAPGLVARAADAFPNLKDRIIQGYGLTETSAISTLNIGRDYLDRPDSVGIAAPTVELRIAGPESDDLPPGEVGEVWIRGANVIPGYWRRPEANRRSFTDGYLHTGDVGYVDEDGFLYITDRAKDVVIRGGENVYCSEVEGVLEGHPDVLEAAVVGSPHPDLGEEVKAIVVAASGATVDGAELTVFCAGHLAPFKIPTVWAIRTEPLPRNPSGKVLKAPLRGGHSATFAVGEDSDSAL